MRSTRYYAGDSDPVINRWFSRLCQEPIWRVSWVIDKSPDRPSKKQRRAAPSQSTAPFVIIKSKQGDNNSSRRKAEARRATDALFKVGAP
jgi:hypothetical protein